MIGAVIPKRGGGEAAGPPGTFAIVGSLGATRSLYSLDGTTWNVPATPIGSGSNRRVTAGPTQFVAVAQDSGARTSPTGNVWTNRVCSGGPRGVAHSPPLGLFATAGNAGNPNNITTSPDGITWTARTCDNSQKTDAEWCGSAFIVCGNGAGRLWRSTDGVTWANIADPVGGTGQPWKIAYSPLLNRIVIVNATAQVGGPFFNQVWYSDDVGLTWTRVLTGIERAWRSVRWSPTRKLFCAVGGPVTGGNGNNSMWSASGILWAQGTMAGDDTWTDLDWSPFVQKFVAVRGSHVIHSADGKAWGPQIALPIAQGADPGIAWGEGIGV